MNDASVAGEASEDKNFLKDRANQRWFGSALIAAAGVVTGGYLLGAGLLRAQEADRSVTVRGLAERAENGREACRERGCQYGSNTVVGGSLKKEKRKG